MPLFIGIGGYLFNSHKLAKISNAVLFKKYCHRLVLPWLIAIVVYTLINQENSTLSPKSILHALAFPFYHLWFVTAFLSWVGLAIFFQKLKITVKVQFFLGLVISLTFLILKHFPEIYKDLMGLNDILAFTLHTFRPYYYVFFIFGIWLKRQRLEYSFSGVVLFSIICFGGLLYLFYMPNSWIEILIFFFFNFPLLLILIKVIRLNLAPKLVIMEWIGVNSLAIYLWHVLPIIIYENLFGIHDSPYYYIVILAFEIVFLTAIYLFTKNRFINNYVFGIKEP